MLEAVKRAVARVTQAGGVSAVVDFGGHDLEGLGSRALLSRPESIVRGCQIIEALIRSGEVDLIVVMKEDNRAK